MNHVQIRAALAELRQIMRQQGMEQPDATLQIDGRGCYVSLWFQPDYRGAETGHRMLYGDTPEDALAKGRGWIVQRRVQAAA